MSTCPAEHDLVGLVDGELSPGDETAVVDHLAECADCCALLGRLEASLRFAVGGLADVGEWTEPAPVRALAFAWRRAAIAAAAALVLAIPVAKLALDRLPPRTLQVQSFFTATDAKLFVDDDVAMRDDELVGWLLMDAQALRREQQEEGEDEERELLALGAFAAAQTRADVLGDDSARARLTDVVERFPGTSSAREARALIATLDVRDD